MLSFLKKRVAPLNLLLLPPYRIIGQICILRQNLTINFSQKNWDIWHKNYTIGKLFWMWIQWYNFYIIYLIFFWLKLKVKVCLEVRVCPIIRRRGSIRNQDFTARFARSERAVNEGSTRPFGSSSVYCRRVPRPKGVFASPRRRPDPLASSLPRSNKLPLRSVSDPAFLLLSSVLDLFFRSPLAWPLSVLIPAWSVLLLLAEQVVTVIQ
jgi:hypothetical protein